MRFHVATGLVVLFGTAPAWAGSATVTINDFAFSPASISVHPGDSVIWNNQDSEPHTATAVDGKSFDTGAIDPGTSASLVFPKRGEYAYHCAIHPEMVGTVEVW